MNMTREIHEQLTDAYKRMASEARYRPAAPSDGLGNSTMPIEELDLEAEASKFAHGWWVQEDERLGVFAIGVPTYSLRPAMVFTIEAARAMCGGAHDLAVDLLNMAAREIAREGPGLGDLMQASSEQRE